MDIARAQITGGILAGGQGRRLGGIDKGWYDLSGRPLIARVLERVQPQCARIVISANRSLARYRALGYPIYRDDDEDAFRGPLAGTATVLRAATTPYVLTVPVDTPLLPLDLTPRLAAAMRPRTEIAFAVCGGRSHRLHALMRRELFEDIQGALAAGTRALHAWHAGLDCVAVEWPESIYFANINREADASALAARLYDD